MIGRKQEIAVLDQMYKSDKSELVALYGRRRVGKTFLIRRHFEDKLLFSFSGLYEGSLQEHLQAFGTEVGRVLGAAMPIKPPESWLEAFEMLKSIVENSRKKKKVIFLDEVPWMATHKSRWLTAFEYFWNGWASGRKDILIVICGSATSWMINKIEKNKGGLYNRVTKRIALAPFALQETEAFLKAKSIKLSKYHVVQLYMMLGGIPHYLDQLQVGDTPKIFANRQFFEKGGSLKTEFSMLFDSLFGEGSVHETIIRALASNRSGLSRAALLAKSKQNSGGGFTKVIEELTASRFVETYLPYGKKNKDRLYKVVDNFCLFHMKFVENRSINNWDSAVGSKSWMAWSGLAFENICQYHIQHITKALGLAGITTFASSWHHQGTDEMPGAQIDLLIDRNDGAMNICEIKFNEQPFVISKKYASELHHKQSALQFHQGVSKTIFYTFITAGGLVDNAYSGQIVDSTVSLEQLFD